MQGLNEQQQPLGQAAPAIQEVPAKSAISANLVKQAIEEPKENLWYLRIMHGVKAGVTIGGPAGTLVAPVLGTAIGTLGGGLLGGISFFILGLPGVREFLEKRFPSLYADIDADLEKAEQDNEVKRTVVKQSFFRLSRSNFAKWDMRFLMGVMAGAGAGAAIGTIFPVIGTAIGAVVGGVVGGIGAVAHNQIVKKIAPETALVNAKAVEEDPTWYSETKHDIPWYIRLVCGEAAGLALGAAIGAFIGTIVFPGIGTAAGAAIGGAIGALGGGGLAWVSPMVFAGFRKVGSFISRQITKIKDYVQLENEVDIENAKQINIEMVDLNKRDDKNWPEVLKEDSYDLPWYVRGFAGASAGALVGASIGTIFPGVGTVIGGFVGAIAGAGLSIASPATFAFFRSIVTAIKNKVFPSDKSAAESASEIEIVSAQKNQTQPEVFDVPWYFRGFFGASVGAAIGAAIGTVIFPGIGTAAGTAFGTLIGAGVFIALPTITAVYSTVTTKVSNWIYGPEKANNDDDASKIPPELTHSGRIPWTVRAMGASLIGGLIGGAIGSIFPGVGTVLGTGVGALLATAIYVGVPALFDFVDRKLFSGRKKEQSHLDTDYPVEDSVVKPGLDNSMNQQPDVVDRITLENGEMVFHKGDDRLMRKEAAATEGKIAAEEAAAKKAADEAAALRALEDKQGQAALPPTMEGRDGGVISSHSADQLGGWAKDIKAVNPGDTKAALLANTAERENGRGNVPSHTDGALAKMEHQEVRPS